MELSFTIVRSAKRRKLAITVERDRSVIVHAPAEATDEAIAKAVESKRQWLYEKIGHKQKYQVLPHPPGKELVSGESADYLGTAYQIQVVESSDANIHLADRFVIPISRGNERKGAMREWYLARAREVIVPRVTTHARELGVTVAKVRIVDNRYRWGSCTVRDNINLNWRLIKAPMFVIDYVIVHELAHLIEANHTPAFWNVVRAHVPRMEKAKAWLKEHGQLLEEDV